MSGLERLIPEGILIAGAIAVLLSGGARPSPRAGVGLGAAVAALSAIAALVVGTGEPLFSGALVFDDMAVTVRTAIGALSAVYLLWLSAQEPGPERRREAAVFVLLATLGGMLMASARELITLFIALELGTMPAYVLMGYRREDSRGLEGALKYFLLSMTTSLVMLYGMSLLYAASGSTAYDAIGVADPGLLGVFAVLFVFVGLLAKMSAAPFHYWAPDAYAGAPAVSVAFVSTVPKVAGTVAFVRLAAVLMPSVPELGVVFAVASLASIVLGNLAAYPQSDVRRLMAYSGVAHAGYMLLALAAATPAGYAAAVYYTLAYAVPSMAVMLVAAEEGTAVDDLAGLAARRPRHAWMMVAFLLSLIGIPPLVGFFGKLYVFLAAVDAGLVWLVVVAVLASVASAGYYFRLVRSMFFADAPEREAARPGALAGIALALCLAATLLAGAFAGELLGVLGLTF